MTICRYFDIAKPYTCRVLNSEGFITGTIRVQRHQQYNYNTKTKHNDDRTEQTTKTATGVIRYCLRIEIANSMSVEIK